MDSKDTIELWLTGITAATALISLGDLAWRRFARRRRERRRAARKKGLLGVLLHRYWTFNTYQLPG